MMALNCRDDELKLDISDGIKLGHDNGTKLGIHDGMELDQMMTWS